MAAKDAPTVAAVIKSYKIPSAWLQKKFALFTAPASASPESGARQSGRGPNVPKRDAEATGKSSITAPLAGRRRHAVICRPLELADREKPSAVICRRTASRVDLDEAIASGIHRFFRAGTSMSHIILSTSEGRLEFLASSPPRITALLRRAGQRVGKDRVERIWRREAPNLAGDTP
jgi:hypothetical protein